MVYPTVTELPRHVEPVTADTFTQDLNEPKAPRSERPSQQAGLQHGGRRAKSGVAREERSHAPQP
jgi:hypothetical protein